MTVRRIFLALVAPLFLALAAVNGGLLYVSEQAEAEKGLEAQALAAAVTTAAFATSHHDLATALSDPVRQQALRRATANIDGLKRLYLVERDLARVLIAGTAYPQVVRMGPPWAPRPDGFARPDAPTALPARPDGAGGQVVIGLAPVTGGGFVVAEIDAGPLAAQLAGLKRLIVGMIAVSGLIGLALAWWLAAGIARELSRTQAMVTAIAEGREPAPPEILRVREARDLAQAVRLMRTSVERRRARGERELALRDRRRDAAAAVRAYRETAFAPLEVQACGMSVAVRMLGAAPPGAFYALHAGDGSCAVVLGECDADTPTAALAQALAARRFLEGHGASAGRLAQAKAAFGVGRIVHYAWTARPTDAAALALVDGENGPRAEAYAARASTVAAEAVIDDIAALLTPSGVVAVLRPASAEGR